MWTLLSFHSESRLLRKLPGTKLNRPPELNFGTSELNNEAQGTPRAVAVLFATHTAEAASNGAAAHMANTTVETAAASASRRAKKPRGR